jgi:RNA polymerase sigma factor (sigma-70 family)
MTSEAFALEGDVRAAMLGDTDAYQRLVGRCANTVCSIALAIVRNVQASEDVAQEVFLVVWTSLRKLRNPASFLPWVRQVTRNQAYLWLREHRRETLDEEALAAAVDVRPDPATSLLHDEERRVLAAVIDDLPEETREVVILYYREGSSARQVGELLGLSEDAVKQRLSRARTRMREEMLRRFGGIVARTVPAAGFATVIGAAITASAPPVSAAVTISAAKAAGGSTVTSVLLLLVKGAGAGALAGVAGVIFGLRPLERTNFDERERRELRRFKAAAIISVVLAAAGFTFTAHLRPHWFWMWMVYLPFAIALSYLYRFRLPRILERRFAAERAIDPTAEARQRRQRRLSLIGLIVGVTSGAVAVLLGIMMAH